MEFFDVYFARIENYAQLIYAFFPQNQGIVYIETMV